jgi:hypothetical protein
MILRPVEGDCGALRAEKGRSMLRPYKGEVAT